MYSFSKRILNFTQVYENLRSSLNSKKRTQKIHISLPSPKNRCLRHFGSLSFVDTRGNKKKNPQFKTKHFKAKYGTLVADIYTAQPSACSWWGRWLGKVNLTSCDTLESIVFQTSNTCTAEAVNNPRLILVMLSTVTSVSKALGLEKEMIGTGKEIYKDWVCLNKCEFNNASHQANQMSYITLSPLGALLFCY